MTVQPSAHTILHRRERRRSGQSLHRLTGLLAAAESIWCSRIWLATAALPILAAGLLVATQDASPAASSALSRPDPSLHQALQLDDLWRLHDGHRPLIPRLLLMGISAAAQGPRLVSLLSFFLSLALALMVWLWLSSEPRLGGFTRRRRLGLVPLLSVLLFSCAQTANWTTPWQLRVFVSLLAFALGASLLLGPPHQRLRLLAAMLLGWLAAYSFSSGLLYWIVLLPLASRPGPWREPRRTLWLSSTAACWLSFVPLAGESAPALSRNPVQLLSFAVTALGAPLFPHSIVAARLAGVAGIATLSFLGLRLLGRTRGLRPRAWLMLWLAAGGYAVGNAVLTGMGRAHLGPSRALVGGCLSVSLLLWVSVAVLALRWTENGDDPQLARRRWIVPMLLLATALLACESAGEAQRFTDQGPTRPTTRIAPRSAGPRLPAGVALTPEPRTDLRPAAPHANP